MLLSVIHRLVEIISNKIFSIQKEDELLENMNSAGTKTYRIEEIPSEELNIMEDEVLVPVAHFQKVTALFYSLVTGIELSNTMYRP